MSEAAALPAAGPPPPAAATPRSVDLRDFPDRLSPMLVKELRQGLRSPMFLWSFLGMHILLLLITLVTLESENRNESPSIYFWWSIVAAIVIIMPLRGFNALIDEIRLNTLDTLVLTRLTAWRIAFGKWSAIAAQEALVAVTILPYLILRYFAGGIDLGRELIWLAIYLVVAWVFTAFVIGFSWMKYFLLRGLVTLGIAAVVLYFCAFSIDQILISRGWGYQRMIGSYETELLLAFFITSAYLIYFMIDSAASQIAPMAENRSTLRRIITLGLAFGVAPLSFADHHVLAAVILGGIAVLAGIDALTEHPKHISVISHPFVRRGAAGKLSGKLLYPGWHSGLFFFLILAALAFLPFYQIAVEEARQYVAHGYGYYSFSRLSPFEREFYDVAEPFLVCLGTALCAFLILRLLFRRSSLPLASFIGILAVLGILHALIAALADAIDAPGLNLVLFFSPISIVIYWDEANLDRLEIETLFWICAAQAGVYAVISILLAAREFRKTHACERQAERDLHHDTPPPERTGEFSPLS